MVHNLLTKGEGECERGSCERVGRRPPVPTRPSLATVEAVLRCWSCSAGLADAAHAMTGAPGCGWEEDWCR
ncbi:hypothetical protein Hamer_G007422 [Homarus americanus]|uniref:Uncharacterized protein n=1 Tax=Homarus americanus TaxID=6706 RepID=A0A8J5JNR8_HOMAM|nr:hypothetical protein Hamer_G007422 [Homarus americanus]